MLVIFKEHKMEFGTIRLRTGFIILGILLIIGALTKDRLSGWTSQDNNEFYRLGWKETQAHELSGDYCSFHEDEAELVSEALYTVSANFVLEQFNTMCGSGKVWVTTVVLALFTSFAALGVNLFLSTRRIAWAYCEASLSFATFLLALIGAQNWVVNGEAAFDRFMQDGERTSGDSVYLVLIVALIFLILTYASACCCLPGVVASGSSPVKFNCVIANFAEVFNRRKREDDETKTPFAKAGAAPMQETENIRAELLDPKHRESLSPKPSNRGWPCFPDEEKRFLAYSPDEDTVKAVTKRNKRPLKKMKVSALC